MPSFHILSLPRKWSKQSFWYVLRKSSKTVQSFVVFALQWVTKMWKQKSKFYHMLQLLEVSVIWYFPCNINFLLLIKLYTRCSLYCNQVVIRPFHKCRRIYRTRTRKKTIYGRLGMRILEKYFTLGWTILHSSVIKIRH